MRQYDYEGIQKCVLVADGFENIPKLRVSDGRKVWFGSSDVLAAGLGRIIQYRDPDREFPKPPEQIISTAPIPDDIVPRLNAESVLLHKVVVLKNGIVYPDFSNPDPTYLNISEDGCVINDFGNERRIIEASQTYKRGWDDVLTRRSFLSPDTKIVSVKGPAIPIAFAPHLHHYFSHFVIQCFPRVSVIRDLRINATFLIPHDLRKKQREMLGAVGIGEERLFVIPKNCAVQADELIVPYPWALGFTSYNTEIYNEILHKFVSAPARPPSKRVLIRRNYRQSYRNLLTYDAIRYRLEEYYGFKEVRPENLSLEEEVRLFNETECLVGAEGAGMYAAIYAQSCAKVISISDEDYAMPLLGGLARVRGFSHYYVLGESFRLEADVARRLPYGHADYTVDPLTVEMAIDLAMNK